MRERRLRAFNTMPPRHDALFALGTGGASMAYDNATFATATAYSCRRDRRGRAAATA